MIEIPGKIPITIHPMFWAMAFLIGWLNSGGDLLWVILWVAIVFFSVLFHEYGHALMSCIFKQQARIQLVFMGGLTSFDGPKLKFWQQFLIVLNGPFFGFLIFLLASFLLHSQFFSTPLAISILKSLAFVNLFWTVLNLLPVAPLDGGQLVRICLEGFFGLKGFKASLLIGAIISVVLAAYFFIVQFYLAGALFSLFAFESFDSWRKCRYIVGEDREIENQKLLMMAREAFILEDFHKSKQLYEKLLEKTSSGILAHEAAQKMAYFLMKEGNHKQSYEMLLSFRDDLSDESKCLLHQLALEFENYALVADLSAVCYQVAPSYQLALRNARSFAFLGNAKLSGGWLQTAWGYGLMDIQKVLNEPCFDRVKNDKEFLQFVSRMTS